ncbi:MAG: hypothetical protein JWP91_1313 [Fibrobacteres bacterium]|nr:hypothetical protein [Fibrobacterota bacterium]
MDDCAPVAPEIYRYYDYHAFLRDYYEWRKTVNPYFSLRYIGGKVGLDAGLVVRILQGKRPLSLKKIAVFASVLALTKRRAEYFELLVLYGRAKSDREAQQYFERLIGFTGLGGKQVERSQYEFYQEWYYTAVREVLHFLPFNGDYESLAGMMVPAISPKEARKAITLLENLGMISRKRDGGFALTDKYLTTGDEWRSFAVRAFQLQSLELARHALEKVPKEARDISTVTLTINGEAIEKIRERVRQFHQEMLEISEQSGIGDRVYQVNLQVFPMAMPVGESAP